MLLRTDRPPHQNHILRREIRARRPLEDPRRDVPVAFLLDVVQEGGGGVFERALDGGYEGIAGGKRVDVEDDVDRRVLDTPYYAGSPWGEVVGYGVIPVGIGGIEI